MLSEVVVKKIEKNIYELCKDYFSKEALQELLSGYDIEDLCRRQSKSCTELLVNYLDNEDFLKKREKEIILNGRKIFSLGVPIAVFLDLFEQINNRISNILDSEKVPKEILKKFRKLRMEFLNIISLGFLWASLEEREKLAESIPSESRRLFTEFISIFKGITENQFSKVEKKLEELEREINKLFITVLSSPGDFRCNIFSLFKLIKHYIFLFKKFYSRNNFTAYIIYEQTVDFIEKLINCYYVLTTKKAVTDLEKLIEFSLKNREENWRLIIIDPSEISFINKVYGFAVGDEIFKKLLKVVSMSFHEDEETAVFKCNEGIVCILTRKLLKKDFSDLHLKLERKIRKKLVSLDVKTHILDLFIPKDCPNVLPLEELKEIVPILIRESKKEEKRYARYNLCNLELIKKAVHFLDFQNYVVEKLKNGDVSIAVQPIVNLQNGKVEHYEVLFRMIDRQKNIIPAYEIIDVIFDLKLIHLLDIAILRKIVRNIDIFKKNNINSIFVNLSPNTLKVEGNLKEILNLLSQISKDLNLGVEITEQALLEEHEILKSLLNKINVPLSLDDFGAGYSSFSSLLKIIESLPLKFLKIDGSYVKNISNSNNSKILVQTINAMAHSLNLKTIAEFVENEEILKLLKELGVDYGQGYYLGRPELFIP
ncbi:EAL domain, c-di-GMP-specific phosphodiesterase class I (or its enzymatically inactive variant) [Balnearium lithotrophicum]|uniref:EAL domain, c-di-GMP-specific phosphodiesterase class I (Or its enzymatically inactive variant) n=1 Tax=Balnearium lithotrophicum TaxID=223788 RepID=A0A521BC05_9BACT|nr:EAL domain-containing protein [Balnearium lithotrophicum]SMO44280.1 EAL domain, c-di-GMP-specific phosphodiesterase class I (or its enzymatically inactive variant) [Balnearium lithotrophicum]